MIRVLKISLKNIDHLFLGDTWGNFDMNDEMCDNIP